MSQPHHGQLLVIEIRNTAHQTFGVTSSHALVENYIS